MPDDRIPLSPNEQVELYLAALSGHARSRLPTDEEMERARADGWDGVALVWEMERDA